MNYFKIQLQHSQRITGIKGQRHYNKINFERLFKDFLLG